MPRFGDISSGKPNLASISTPTPGSPQTPAAPPAPPPVIPTTVAGPAHGSADRSNSIQDMDMIRQRGVVKAIFFTIFITEILINFDSGAVPAVLDYIKKDFELSPVAEGLLGGLQYIGLVIMSPISGYVLQKFDTKWVLVCSLVCNLGFVVMLGCATSKGWLLFSRLGIGITQTTPCVYAPVWVDEFALEGYATTWMSVLQAGVPLGVMVGYSVAGAMASAGVKWNWSIIVQAFMIAPVCILLFICPGHYFDVRSATASADDKLAKELEMGRTKSDGTDRGSLDGSVDISSARSRTDSVAGLAGGRGRCDSLWMYTEEGGGASAANLGLKKQLRLLVRSKTWIAVTAGLCALYFVVTGVQFWMTIYLVKVIKADYGAVLGAFAATSATGPVIGVVFGGWFIDRVGGYQGVGGRAKTAFYCAVFANIAVAFAIPAAFAKSFPVIIALIWLVLFWGGAIIPGATGLLLAAVNSDLRQFSSAISMFTYNIFGYAGGTIFPAICIQMMQNSYVDDGMERDLAEEKSLRTGVQMILFWALFGGVFLTWSAWVSHQENLRAIARTERRKARRAKAKQQVQQREQQRQQQQMKLKALPASTTEIESHAVPMVGDVGTTQQSMEVEDAESSDDEANDMDDVSPEQWREIVLYETGRQRAQTGAGLMPAVIL